jgi:branched-chain amino acid aminotransferase
MMSAFTLIDGELKPLESSAIPFGDRGFLFGDGIFETLVSFGPKILKLHAHLQRLRQSANTLDIDLPWSDPQIQFSLESLAERTISEKKIIKVIVTRGSSIHLKPPSDLIPNLYAMVYPAADLSAKDWHQGIRLKTKINGASIIEPRPKTLNYLPEILALKQAVRSGFDDILWTNHQGEIMEASTANIFFMGRHGDHLEVATPGSKSGILMGTTRKTLIDLLQISQIPVEEKLVFSDELARFDEAFLCSSVRGLIPVNQIDRQTYHTTRPHAIFHEIRRLFQSWFYREVGAKLDWNTGKPLK